ncbi:MAG TPA: bifunctional riboflavin kinase/FAD synthetase [Verrucomicrobiae bacterium]|jgi:riboflavin kinase/FMN adenylyltransferase|nr:bifunctional riboflavin kinase/FAD synthetase [Verrucomicrobiae bacterium]
MIHTAIDLSSGNRKVCLAIGFFDGVHLGHQQIIRQTISDARQHGALALVITFDQHPNSIVAPTRVPPLIYSLPQKLRTIESLGPEALLLIHFDKAFSQKTGEAFIRELAGAWSGIQSICVGANFVFGHKRGGNVDLLKQLGAELKFIVHGMAAVSLDRKPVSSTRIREAIHAGELDLASQMLGRAYSIAAPVVEGDKLGRRLGFPTANLDATGLALPPNGVYAIQAIARGKNYRAVLNIGTRPTLENPNPAVRVEAHLLDFNGDLYGEELEIIFAEKLRDERKFPSVEELKAQIARDIERAKESL